MSQGEDQPKAKNRIHHIMTRKYIVALGLISLVMISGYVLTLYKVQENYTHASIIDVSGRQRMLTQRIAFLSHAILQAKNKQEADQYAEQLASSSKLLKKQHNMLIGIEKGLDARALHSDAIQTLYFGPGGIDELLNDYTSKVDGLLRHYRQSKRSNIQEKDVLEIQKIANIEILQKLDNIVSAYKAEVESDLDHFLLMKTAIFSFGLLVLLLDFIFIFRPMGQHIKAYIRELKYKNEELTQFAYRTSHDLKSPLIAVSNILQLLKELIEKKDTEETIPLIEMAERSVFKLKNLVEDIVGLIKTEQMKQENVELHFRRLVEGALEKMAHLENFDKISITIKDFHEKVFLGQKIRLEQVLENLLSNAVKYADFSKEKQSIIIQFEKKRDDFKISIVDNGLGIPHEYQSKMFEMFQRFHPRVAFGSGLGMYIVKKNIEMMKGDIYFESSPDGTSFFITLPEIEEE